ncbi:hypothetical protein SAMN05892883_4177 [Jatrophihabitans sp. GAS493]|nr:hypothetical protein SAMN05892883_4177 [Jatrophihabitans sp. GAS493]
MSDINYYGYGKQYYGANLNPGAIVDVARYWDAITPVIHDIAQGYRGTYDISTLETFASLVLALRGWVSSESGDYNTWAQDLASKDANFQGMAAAVILQRIESDRDALADWFDQLGEHGQPLDLALSDAAAKGRAMGTALQATHAEFALFGIFANLNRTVLAIEKAIYDWLVTSGLIHGVPGYQLDNVYKTGGPTSGGTMNIPLLGAETMVEWTITQALTKAQLGYPVNATVDLTTQAGWTAINDNLTALLNKDLDDLDAAFRLAIGPYNDALVVLNKALNPLTDPPASTAGSGTSGGGVAGLDPTLTDPRLQDVPGDGSGTVPDASSLGLGDGSATAPGASSLGLGDGSGNAGLPTTLTPDGGSTSSLGPNDALSSGNPGVALPATLPGVGGSGATSALGGADGTKLGSLGQLLNPDGTPVLGPNGELLGANGKPLTDAAGNLLGADGKPLSGIGGTLSSGLRDSTTPTAGTLGDGNGGSGQGTSGGASSGSNFGGEPPTTTSSAGGMPYMPPMGGMGGNQGKKERERQTWINEDEAVWGTSTAAGFGVIGRCNDEEESAIEDLGMPHRPGQVPGWKRRTTSRSTTRPTTHASTQPAEPSTDDPDIDVDIEAHTGTPTQ